MTSQLLETISIEFPSLPRITFSICDTTQTSPLHIKRSVSTLNNLTNFATVVIPFDNSTLKSIWSKISHRIYGFNYSSNTTQDWNEIIVRAINLITSCYRWKTEFGIDISKFHLETCVYPRMKFYCVGLIPTTIPKLDVIYQTRSKHFKNIIKVDTEEKVVFSISCS